MQRTRTEHDSFGPIEVPADAMWGAQTQRSLHFFAIGAQCMPLPIIHALGWIKWAAAVVNQQLGLQAATTSAAIAAAALRVAQGELDDQFPLSVWQTGSGTQSHMNVNEVIAHLASHTVAVHANDDVNRGQSSNDVFPSAMHIAVALMAKQHLLPALTHMRSALMAKALKFHSVIKVGRTHWQDATPVTLGQEFAGYAAQLDICNDAIAHALKAVHTLAIGGTAVGTGLNTHPEFGARVAHLLSNKLHVSLTQAPNLFAAMAGHEALVGYHSSLKMLAIALTKIGNDIRVMGSGPRAGLGELALPQNEPGSSIMPGKVNPTQIEALTMVCAQVMGHDTAIGFAASQGHFELNVYKPLIALNTLDSTQLLADAMRSLVTHCVSGITANEAHLTQQLQSSLMLVTALVPHFGYDKCAQIAKHAYTHQSTLREAAVALGFVTAEQFDAWVRPQDMLSSHPYSTR